MSVLTLFATAALVLTGVGTDPAVVVPAATPPAPSISSAAPSSNVFVPDPYAKDQIRPSESLSPESRAQIPTRPLSGAPSPTSAPATGSPAVRVIRISAIHIDRPVKIPQTPASVTSVASSPTVVPPSTTTVTQTVTIAPAEAEEDVVEQAQKHRQVDAGAVCVAPKGNYGGVKPYVGIIGAHIQKRFGVTMVAGKADRANASEHPKGLALDFMTNTGNVDGDAIRDYMLAHAKDFNVKYVIWQQKLYLPGEPPRDMEDRGSDTANHRDHVHVSFNDAPGPVTPTC